MPSIPPGWMGDPADVPSSLDRAAEAEARNAAQQYELQSKQLALQGRTVEANIAHQKAQIALRKAELAQQKYLTERQQQLSASGLMAQLRGPGNAAQFIDLGRRLSSFGTQSGALAQLAAGGMAQGAFSPGGAGKPTTMQERMSGMLGAPSETAIDQRDAADKQLAVKISSNTNKLARGSLESISPYERAYLGSYSEAGGFDWDAVTDAYKRAGVMQGRRG
jgi:hypothetical protein